MGENVDLEILRNQKVRLHFVHEHILPNVSPLISLQIEQSFRPNSIRRRVASHHGLLPIDKMGEVLDQDLPHDLRVHDVKEGGAG